MNVNQLKYFIEFVRTRNFSKAAERLRISQPALSLQIQKLEEEFEYQLINRTKKPLGLTPEGELFYEKALKIVQQIEDLSNLSLEIDENHKGKLTVGIIPTLSPYLVPLFVDEMKKKYPMLFLDIVELNTEEIVSQLTYNELDIGILSTPLKAKNIGFVPLFQERFYLYVSEKHDMYKIEKVELDKLPLDELWYLREGNCFQNQVNSICQIPELDNTNLSFRYVSYSIESLRRIVENQGGMTFIPELATVNVPTENEDMIKTFEDPAPLREISAAYLKTTGLKKTAGLLLDVIVANIPSRMRLNDKAKPIDTKIRL
ncbi:LysR family transcriptional regulator [Sunxiuqinia sp. A32]|uniref:LysR family transcriptional regulator n=1 Tax=Sunxiuqinia sp. A32 TaxID=3461496 RepID=UPI004045C9D9